MSPKKIRELRVRAGLSQTELGDKLHVSQMTVSNWETKRVVPNKEQEASLKRILGLGIAEDETECIAHCSVGYQGQDIEEPFRAGACGALRTHTPRDIRIESGGTRDLRSSTRQKLEKALGRMPEDAAEEAAEDAAISGLGSLEDFDPHSDEERPTEPGIYVLYDISERPIYVGEGSNVKKRIRDHEEKFWFKRPIVETASWIKVEERHSTQPDRGNSH